MCRHTLGPSPSRQYKHFPHLLDHQSFVTSYQIVWRKPRRSHDDRVGTEAGTKKTTVLFAPKYVISLRQRNSSIYNFWAILVRLFLRLQDRPQRELFIIETLGILSNLKWLILCQGMRCIQRKRKIKHYFFRVRNRELDRVSQRTTVYRSLSIFLPSNFSFTLKFSCYFSRVQRYIG